MNRIPCQVLLLSAAPEAHRNLLHSLDVRGIRTRTASSSLEAEMALIGRPGILLVDLTYGAGIDARTVAAINRRPGHILVVGLHEGAFGDVRDVWGLNVDGFCRAGDWRPIAEAMPGAEGLALQ